jgi:two-component system CheB/CheR fusion protein
VTFRDGTSRAVRIDVDDDAPAAGFEKYPVVGIGASAGGLEALERLFSAVPAHPGMAFVVVTHAQVGHPALLPELLARRTRLPVTAVAAETPIEIDHVYVAPSGKHLAIRGSALVPEERPAALPAPTAVDHFFRSLAAARNRFAIGVVLSGTGSDGTLGIREIKAAGGLTVAQDEASAQFPGMPHSAAATKLVDYVLAPADMPGCLVDYGRRAFGAVPVVPDQPDDEDVQRVLTLLRRHTGNDFSSYKRGTVGRRIERRMAVHHLDTVRDYASFVDARPDELEALLKELLIGVTSFFRDPPAYAVLARELMAMVTAHSAETPLRAWVAGCSTGEEAYSIAIVLRECIEATQRPVPVQIFATDLDPDAIAIARRGVFAESIVADVSAERLARFFVHEDATYRVRKELREMFVFASHNLISDPPFARVDLLSCRNVLI